MNLFVKVCTLVSKRPVEDYKKENNDSMYGVIYVLSVKI